jgi:hypothetical protein
MKKATKIILGGIGAIATAAIFYSIDVISEAVLGLLNDKWINVPKRDGNNQKDYNDEDVVEIKE